MGFILSAVAVTDAMQEVPVQAPSNDIIGIGGIIATLVVGILTCLITWKLTMKSIKQMKMSYNIQIYPILSNPFTKSPEWNWDNLKIQYKDKLLQNPCLLTLEIANTGNEAINEPPIRIKNDENIEIIPGYLENVPHGYEELWILDKDAQYSCSLILKHINPKQIVKARFFLDNLPQKKITFECPMPNIQIQEVSYSNIGKSPHVVTGYSKSNLILIALTVLLFVTIPQWSYFINNFIWITDISLQTDCVVAFIMSMLLLAIILNTYGIPSIDLYITSHLNQSMFIKCGLVIVSAVLLGLIIFDCIIIGFIPQIITAIIAVILLALFIHFLFITKKGM